MRILVAVLMFAAGLVGPGAMTGEAAPPCGTSGVLTGAGMCTYTASGEDMFNVPVTAGMVHVVAVGAQGGAGGDGIDFGCRPTCGGGRGFVALSEAGRERALERF